MPARGTKRPRLLHCDGDGCGQPGCSSCYPHFDQDPGWSALQWGGAVSKPPDTAESGDARQVTPSRQKRIGAEMSGSPVVDFTGDMDDNGDEGGSTSRQQGGGFSQGTSRRAQQSISSPAAPAPEEDGDDKGDRAPSFKEMIDALDEKTVRSTLARLASMAPSAQTVIKQVYTQQLREREQNRQQQEEKTLESIDFDHHSKKAWHALHTSATAKDWAYLDESRRTNAARRALEGIVGQVADMRSHIREATPFDTKLSALETVRKMLKSVLLGSSALAVAVRDELRPEGVADGIGDDLVLILMSMDEESDEMARAGGTADEKGTLAQKFAWCRDEARRFDLRALKGLDTVLKLMGTPVRGPTWA